MKALRAVAVAVAVIIVLASCETVNKLDRFHEENATLAVSMKAAPDPQFDVSYHLKLDSNDVLGSALSIGTSAIKAAGASQAESRMRKALDQVDVPGTVLSESTTACASALDAQVLSRKSQADYLLSLEIKRWGIDANNPGGAVRLHLELTASLYNNKADELIWRRGISVNQQANPDMFGAGEYLENFVTAAALADMTTDQLAQGFDSLAKSAARSVARHLEDDLYAAKYQN